MNKIILFIICLVIQVEAQWIPLDKNRFFVSENGVELVSNGTFTSNTTGWTALASSGTNPTLSSTGGRLRMTNVGTATGARAYQAFTTIVGRRYRAMGNVFVGTAPNVGIAAANGITGASLNFSLMTSDGFILFYFTATATTTYVRLFSDMTSDGKYAEFDDVSIQEVF